MVTVTSNGTIVASSNDPVSLEGNFYLPPTALKMEYFKPSTTHTTCPYKGTASYYHLEVPGQTKVSDAAWYYPNTKAGAKNVEGYVAFYKNKVNVTN